MSEYESVYEWWRNNPDAQEVLKWSVTDNGITIGAILEALQRHPGRMLAILEHEYRRICLEVIEPDLDGEIIETKEEYDTRITK